MEQTIKIRSALIADLDNVFAFISHLEETTFEFKAFNERFMLNIENENCIYLVAANEYDEAIGFISCQGQYLLHHEGLVFEIQEMYVARNFRDKGIGKLLFAALEEKLKEVDCASFEVTTNVKRNDARRFYTKLGFVQTHVKFVKAI